MYFVVSQKKIIDIGISDHQLILCTRKTLKTKTGSHKQIRQGPIQTKTGSHKQIRQGPIQTKTGSHKQIRQGPIQTKTGSHKQISFHSLNNYNVVAYEEALKFPNYENFININEAYSNFIQRLTSVIDVIATCKTKRVKCISKEWFDSVVSEGINKRDKLFKKF